MWPEDLDGYALRDAFANQVVLPVSPSKERNVRREDPDRAGPPARQASRLDWGGVNDRPLRSREPDQGLPDLQRPRSAVRRKVAQVHSRGRRSQIQQRIGPGRVRSPARALLRPAAPHKPSRTVCPTIYPLARAYSRSEATWQLEETPKSGFPE